MSALTHWAEVNKEHTTVQEFLSWLHREYGVQLDWDSANPGTPLDVGKLLDEFFEVDRVQLDRERLELLDQYRDD